MTMHNSLHTGSAAHAVLSALDGRLAQAGLLAPDPTTGVRLGVLYPEIGGFAIAGTSSTSPWQYSVPGATFVMSKGTLDGPHVGTNDAPYLASTTAPPASNSRYDVIYVMQQDADATISPDASTTPVISVVQGTAAASPTIPSIPVGAYQLAHALVASTAVAGTSGAGVTITQDWQWTVPAGVPIPVRSATERNLITWGTAAASVDVNRLDTNSIERNAGSGWVTITNDDSGWITPTLLNSWVNFSPSYRQVAYRRLNRVVYVEGVIKGGASVVGQAIFNLPAGFRPASTAPAVIMRTVASAASGGSSPIEVDGSTGNVQQGATGISATWTSFGFSFPQEA